MVKCRTFNSGRLTLRNAFVMTWVAGILFLATGLQATFAASTWEHGVRPLPGTATTTAAPSPRYSVPSRNSDPVIENPLYFTGGPHLGPVSTAGCRSGSSRHTGTEAGLDFVIGGDRLVRSMAAGTVSYVGWL